MCTFEVEQDEPMSMHQDVLGAEIAEHKSPFVIWPVHFGDERIDLRGEVRMGPGGRSIVGVDAKLVSSLSITTGSPGTFRGSQCNDVPLGPFIVDNNVTL